MATHISVVLDKSGSMMSIRDATISGMNEYIDSLKNGRKKILVSMLAFDSEEMKELCTAVPLDKATRLTPENYVPGALTPLYDAIGTAITRLEKKVKTKRDRALVVIMTDGEENASREWDRTKVFDKIKEMEAKGNWSFVYLGANQDVYAVSQAMGIAPVNAMSYAATPAGMRGTTQQLSHSTIAYVQSASPVADAFFGGDPVAGTPVQVTTPQYQTVREWAETHNISTGTVRRHIRQGTLKAHKTPGGHIRIDADENADYLSRQARS